MRFATATATGLIAVLIFWQALEIVPVQVAAVLVMLGWIQRVSVAAVAAFDVLFLVVVAAWYLATRRSDSPSWKQSSPREPLPAYILAAATLLLGSYLAFALGVFTGSPFG